MPAGRGLAWIGAWQEGQGLDMQMAGCVDVCCDGWWSSDDSPFFLVAAFASCSVVLLLVVLPFVKHAFQKLLNMLPPCLVRGCSVPQIGFPLV